MSCTDCEAQQNHYFFRWQNANVEFICCERHFTEIQRVLISYQDIPNLNEKLKLLMTFEADKDMFGAPFVDFITQNLPKIFTTWYDTQNPDKNK